ncbi:unnamed protein product [Ilex paraguariensis]|uniref:Uncharacterized protein n=1 Tax=Ilex paraguariensis TaxID=185542 RepID=A0ABC8RU54_9AQUA
MMSSPVPLKCLSNNHKNDNKCGTKLGDFSPQQSPTPDAVPSQSLMSGAAPLQSLLVLGRSAMNDLTSESGSSNAALFKSVVLLENQKNLVLLSVKDGFSLSDSDHMSETVDEELMASDIDVAAAKEEKSNIYFHLRKKKSEEVQDQGKATGGGRHANADKEKEKMPKFSMALSPEEIEEDIFAMTGSKPSRKPKSRGKAVQRQLDNVFPGLGLGSITPNKYKVYEAPPKSFEGGTDHICVEIKGN